MACLELERIVQRYGSHTVIDGVRLRVEAGASACLLGASGYGKTTLLRCIAGFEEIAAGEIRLQGRTISTNERRVEVELGALQSRLPLECSQGRDACGRGRGVEVLLRPDDIIHDDQGELLAEVRHKAFRGAEVLSLVPSHHNHAIGERMGIRLDADRVVAFKTPAPTGRLATTQAIRFHP